MSEGEVRDQWDDERRVVGPRQVTDAQRGGLPHRERGRGPGSADDAPLRRVAPGPGGARATGAPRPVASTRPLAPTSPSARRDGADSPRSGQRIGADDIAYERGHAGGVPPVAPALARRAPRPRAGWRRFMPILLGLGAGIVVVALALGALLIFAPRVAPPPAPSATMQALCADLTTQRYADAYALLSPRLQAQGSQAQFVASQRELDALQGDVTTCSPATVNVAGTTASAALQVTRAHAKTTSAAVTLTAIGSAWRVDAYDTAVI